MNLAKKYIRNPKDVVSSQPIIHFGGESFMQYFRQYNLPNQSKVIVSQYF